MFLRGGKCSPPSEKICINFLEIQMKNKEGMKFKFRGFYFSGEALEIIFRNNLSITDILVILAVEGLSRGGKGKCFATNKYLSMLLNGNKTYISEVISKLQSKGILRTYYEKGRRYIESLLPKKKRKEDQFTNEEGQIQIPEVKELTMNEIIELRNLPYSEYLLTSHWRAIRQKALCLAKFKCHLCNNKNCLQVHHKTYINIGHESMEDIVVLCESCHNRFHQAFNTVKI